MANNRWRDEKANGRWNDPEQIRVSRRFRYHVRTPKNPNGRIHRELCFNRKNCSSAVAAEFHHVDYSNPFKGCWVCFSCHRKVDHGTLPVPQRAIWDYSSLVVTAPSRWRKDSPPEMGTPETSGSPSEPDVPF